MARRNVALAALPPNIDEITAILTQQKLANPKLAAKRRRAASRKPPKTKSKTKLAKFYIDRSLAAGRIGKTDQEFNDLEKAVRLAKASKNRDVMRSATQRLADAAGAQGLRKRELELREAALKLARFDGARVGSGSILAAVHANYGEVKKAEAGVARVKNILRKGLRENVWKKYGQDFIARVKFAQAAIFNAKGRNQEAEVLFRDAIELADRGIKQKTALAKYNKYMRQVMRARLARILETEGRLVEAEVVLRKALLDRLEETGLYSTWTPRLIVRFAEHLAVQGRYAEAGKLANIAIEVMRKLGFVDGSQRIVSAKLLLARLEFLSGREDAALSIYDDVTRTVQDNTALFQRVVQTDIDRTLVIARAGRHAEVVDALGKSMATYGETVADQKLAGTVMRGALAIALQKSGNAESAYAEFSKVIPKLLSVNEVQVDEEYTLVTARAYRTKVLLEAYMALLADIRGTPLEAKLGIDAAEEGFKIADAGRGQSVQRAVSAAAARATIRDPALADLARTEQDTRKQLTAQGSLLAGILATPLDQQDRTVVKNLRRNITRLQAANATLNADIKRRFPDYASLLNPEPPAMATIRETLQPGEAYVSIYIGKDRSFVWAVPKTGEPVFHAGNLNEAKVAQMVATLRKSLNPKNAETLGDIPEFDVGVAHALYRQLLEPIAAGWRPAKSLLVSSNGVLAQLPLTVLPVAASGGSNQTNALFGNYRNIKWLARTHAVTVLPSAASLVTLRRLPRPERNRKPFIGIGDPVFSKAQLVAAKPNARRKVARAGVDRAVRFNARNIRVRLRATPGAKEIKKPDFSLLPALPDTAEEVRSMAISMKTDLATSLLLGAKANEEAVKKKDLSNYRVVAFATHGLIPGDLGLRQPALALSDPELVKSEGDGLLTMSEIMGLKLDADWVILSACNTGSARGNGAEAISGLGRAFFYAGSRSLLVSSWPVESVSARLLTTDVFARLSNNKSLTRATALQQASSALIDRPGEHHPETKEPVYYYAHPIFWAPFMLVGDGGAAQLQKSAQ